MIQEDSRNIMWTLGLLALLGVIYAVFLVRAEDDCDRQHGKLVQGIGWFTCVAAPEAPKGAP